MDGRLYGVPHNVDAKLLHYRIEIDDTARRDWNELVATARRLSDGALLYGFVLPAMDSGLFGMFYELAEMVGASLFPAANIPRLNNEGGRWAPTIIRDLRCLRAVPAEIVNWYFDKVHRCFLEGSAAMVCDWPGYYGTYRYSPDFKVRETFQVARMPGGPVDGNKAYGGSHTFALTRRGAASPSAVALLRFLTSPEEQLLEARQGSVPPRPPILAQVQSEAEPPRAARWRLLDSVKSNDILIPSRLPYYPEIEETLWQTVRSAMM
jgi:multiple sugar transport system substrate-binding protein